MKDFFAIASKPFDLYAGSHIENATPGPKGFEMLAALWREELLAVGIGAILILGPAIVLHLYMLWQGKCDSKKPYIAPTEEQARQLCKELGWD